jgi:hypothetical protein
MILIDMFLIIFRFPTCLLFLSIWGVTISHAATIGLSQVWRVRSAIDHSILLDDCDWKGHRKTSSDEQLPLER